MKAYIVSSVQPMYTPTPTGATPCDLAVPGALYVTALYLNNWSGFNAKAISHIDGFGRVMINLIYPSRIVENGIIHVGSPRECREHYEYSWSRAGMAFLSPLNECMFEVGGSRPGLLAARQGYYVKDTTKAHLFAHEGGAYRTVCHISLLWGDGQYLKLRKGVTCSYCERKLSEGVVYYAGFMRA